MSDNSKEMLIIEKIKSMFKPKKIVQVGDIGIYQDIISIGTLNEGVYPLNNRIYVKIEALAIYDTLIEIKVLDIATSNVCDEGIATIIKQNIPKYVLVKHIKWKNKN